MSAVEEWKKMCKKRRDSVGWNESRGGNGQFYKDYPGTKILKLLINSLRNASFSGNLTRSSPV